MSQQQPQATIGLLDQDSKAVQLVGLILVFSLMTTSSLAINSFIQSIFESLPLKPSNIILANLLWVLIIVSITIAVAIYVSRDRPLNPGFFRA